MINAMFSTGAQISTGTGYYVTHARAYERGIGSSVLSRAPVLNGRQPARQVGSR